MAAQVVELLRDKQIGPLLHAAFGSLDALGGARRPRVGTESLTGFEALSWKLQGELGLEPEFTNVTVLSRSPDLEGVRDRMRAMVVALPRLRQHVGVEGRSPPAWFDVPDFDVDAHLSRVECPPPGTLEQLVDVANDLTATPLERGRPLWQLTVVDGLAGGRSALVQHVHHAVTDGAGGVRALGVLFGTHGDAHRNAHEAPPVASHGASTSFLGGLRRLVSAALGAVDPRINPVTALEFVRGQFLIGRSPASALVAARHGAHRRFGTHSLSMARVRRAVKALGGSRNDLLVAGVVGALDAYHRQLGQPCEQLRMGVPILRRSGRRQVGGNDVTVVTVEMPIGFRDAGERLRSVRERLGRLAADPAVGLSDLGLDVLGMLPAPVVTAVTAAHNRNVDFVVSTVPGMRTQGSLGGAAVEASYPFGPRSGAGLNVTALRCHDRIDLGLNLDPAAFVDADRFLRCLVDSYEALFDAAGAPDSSRPVSLDMSSAPGRAPAPT